MEEHFFRVGLVHLAAIGLNVDFDHNILIVSDKDIIVNRLLDRGLDIQDINQRLNNQMSIEEKIKRADKIIYNNGSLSDLYNVVDEVLKQIL